MSGDLKRRYLLTTSNVFAVPFNSSSCPKKEALWSTSNKLLGQLSVHLPFDGQLCRCLGAGQLGWTVRQTVAIANCNDLLTTPQFIIVLLRSTALIVKVSLASRARFQVPLSTPFICPSIVL